MKENMLVLSASHGVLENGQEYASLIVASGKYSRVQRDNKTGIDAQKMRCTSDLSKRFNREKELPCLVTVEFELEGAKGVPLAYDAVTYPKTRSKIDAFFEDLLASAVEAPLIPSGITPVTGSPIPTGITSLSREELLKQTTTPLPKP
jgi:hypothetical protein